MKRLSWIDIAKGVGIILVLYGHALNGNSFRYVIYSFHMPLFFFLSGIVFRHLDHETFLSFLKKDARKILIPYLIFAFVGLLLWALTTNPDYRSPEAIVRHIFGIFYGSGATSGYLGYNVALWFLPCLFLTKVLFWLITNASEKKYVIAFILALLAVIGYLGSLYFPDLKLPFGAEIAVTAVVFFGAGYLLHEVKTGSKALFRKYSLMFAVILAAITIGVATISFWTYGLQVDMRLNRLHDFGYFYFAAFSGILLTIALSVKIGANRVLEYLGKRSMMLFVWHQIVFLYISKIFLLFVDNRFLNTYKNTLLAPVYTILAILVIFFIANIFRALHKNFLSRSYGEMN